MSPVMSTHESIQHTCTETSQASPALLTSGDADLNKDWCPLKELHVAGDIDLPDSPGLGGAPRGLNHILTAQNRQLALPGKVWWGFLEVVTSEVGLKAE